MEELFELAFDVGMVKYVMVLRVELKLVQEWVLQLAPVAVEQVPKLAPVALEEVLAPELAPELAPVPLAVAVA